MKYLHLVFELTFSASVFSLSALSAAVDSSVGYEQAALSAPTLPDFNAPAIALVETVTFSAQTVEGVFATFFALFAFIPIPVRFLRKLLIPDIGGIWAQIFSWTVGIGITLLGWAFHLCFLNNLSFWMALLYGAGACLAANEIFDTGLISAIFGLSRHKAIN
jgi:hypothetical protein